MEDRNKEEELLHLYDHSFYSCGVLITLNNKSIIEPLCMAQYI